MMAHQQRLDLGGRTVPTADPHDLGRMAQYEACRPLLERGTCRGRSRPDPGPDGATGSGRGEASLRRGRDELSLSVSRERQARSDVLASEIGEIAKDLRLRHARCEVFEDVVDGDAQAADARLPAPLAWFDRDDLPVVHAARLRRVRPVVNVERALHGHAGAGSECHQSVTDASQRGARDGHLAHLRPVPGTLAIARNDSTSGAAHPGF